MKNQVQLIGYLIEKTDAIRMTNGSYICNLSIVVPDLHYSARIGESMFSISLIGETALYAESFLRIGEEVCVIGALSSDFDPDNFNGNHRTEIIATHIFKTATKEKAA